jgi:hypothetical protein
MAATEEPKRPMTAYFLYIQANRDAVQKELGVKEFGPVTKALATRWKALGAKEKADYAKQAADAKSNYKKAMEAFLAAGGVKDTKRNERNDEKGARAAKKAKKEADATSDEDEKDAKNDAKAAKKAKKEEDANSGKPKRPVGGAYGLYLAHNRADIHKSLPAGSNGAAVAKIAAERWKSLSAKDKETYEEEYKVVKEKYFKDLATWKKATAANDNDDVDADATGGA